MAFDLDSIIEDKPLMLSTAVSAGQATIDTAYEVDKLADLVDFVNLMAYDVTPILLTFKSQLI